MLVIWLPLFCLPFEMFMLFHFQFAYIVTIFLSGLGPGCRHKVTVTSVGDASSTGVILEHVQNSAAVMFRTLQGGELMSFVVLCGKCNFIQDTIKKATQRNYLIVVGCPSVLKQLKSSSAI